MASKYDMLLWLERLKDYAENGGSYDRYLCHLVGNLGNAIETSVFSKPHKNAAPSKAVPEVSSDEVVEDDVICYEEYADFEDNHDSSPSPAPLSHKNVGSDGGVSSGEELVAKVEDFTEEDEEMKIRLQRFALKEFGILPKNFTTSEYIPLEMYYRRYRSSIDGKSEGRYGAVLDLLNGTHGRSSTSDDNWKKVLLKGKTDWYYGDWLPFLDYFLVNLAVLLCSDSLHLVESLDERECPFSELRISLKRVLESDPTLLDVESRDKLSGALVDVLSAFDLFGDDMSESDKFEIVNNRIVYRFFPVLLDGRLCFNADQVADCLAEEDDGEERKFVVEEAAPLEGKWFGGDLKVFFGSEEPCRLGSERAVYKEVDEGSDYNYEVFGMRIVRTVEAECLPLLERTFRKVYEFPSNGQSYKFKRYNFDDVLDYISTMTDVRKFGEKLPFDPGEGTIFRKFSDVVPFVTFNLVLATGNLEISHADVYGTVSELRSYKKEQYTEDVFRLALRSNNLGKVEERLPDSFLTELLLHINFRA